MNDQPHLPPGVELPSKDLLEVADQEVGVVVLTSVVLQDDTDHWAYLSVKPSKYMEFKEVEQRGNYNLRDYGDVLAHGPGKEPPVAVRREMEMYFNVNHNFEEEVIEVYDVLREQMAKEQEIAMENLEESNKQAEKDRLLSKYTNKKPKK